MADNYVLCRRDVGDIGTVKYCAKPITRKNRLNWCDDCLAQLPYWPVDVKPD